MEQITHVIEVAVVARELNDATSGSEAETSEPELPDGLKELLQLLKFNHSNVPEGKLAVERFPQLHLEKYGEFFREESDELENRPLRKRTDFEREVRLKVLKALGRCVTLTEVNNKSLHLTVAEWEALLTPLHLNAGLSTVIWNALESAETEATIAEYWRHLFMNSSSIKVLRLWGGVREAFAAAVSSGLEANPHVALETLDVGRVADAGVAIHVAKMIELSTCLQKLEIHDMWAWTMIDGAVQALGEAISEATSLQQVTIISAAWTEPPDQFFEHPYHWIVDLLPTLLKTSISHISVADNSWHLLSLNQWRDLGSNFLLPTAVKELVLSCSPQELTFLDKLEITLEGLNKFHNASSRSPIIVFQCFLQLNPDSSFDEFNRTLQCCSIDSLPKILHFSQPPIDDLLFQSAVAVLKETEVVRSIKFVQARGGSQRGWKSFFDTLRVNTSVTSLEITDCDSLGEEEFKDFLEILQVNFTLENISLAGTPWELDGKSAIIKEAVDRNSKQANYFSVMRKAKFSFDGPKAGRIFLCGPPYAGKSQLKVSMMKSLFQTSTSESLPQGASCFCGLLGGPQRTRGIEIELLRNNAEHNISIWDLAGQHIFRALQDSLFPRSSQTCIFVFVFSPWDRSSKRYCLKADPLTDFAKELEVWLRFIASNTPVTGHTLPVLLVIITNNDKCEKEDRAGAIFHTHDIRDRVNQLRQKFHGVVDLCPDVHRINRINAKSLEDVQEITQYLLGHMDELLKKKSHIVPRACSDLISHLHNASDDISPSPVWVSSQFYQYCSGAHEILKAFDPADEEGKKVIQAVTSYLHDVGTIIIIRRSSGQEDDYTRNENSVGKSPGDKEAEGGEDLIVVDPNWLTQNFLGELISLGHLFEKEKNKSSRSYITHDGFVDIGNLRLLVKDVMKSRRNRTREVEFQTILELMLGLDLCYEVESGGGVQRYFMPSIGGRQEDDIVHGTGKKYYTLDWQTICEPNTPVQYFGFRLQCSDSNRTSLSWAFFPRYQVHLRKHFQRQKISDDHFKFSRNYMEIFVHGYHIFVEGDNSFAANHVDILVRSACLRSDVDVAKQFVRKHIVDVMTAFCASSKGCPGVQLVLSIIRTECVRRLVPLEYRGKNQCVLVSELKQNLYEDVKTRLATDLLDSDSLFSYRYSWPEICIHGNIILPRDSEEAHNLLAEKDAQDILRMIGEDHNQLCDELCKDSQRLDQVSLRLSHSHCPEKANLVVEKPTVNSTSLPEENEISSEECRLEPSDKENLLILGKLEVILRNTNSIKRTMKKLSHILEQGFKQVKNDQQAFKVIITEIRRKMDTVNSRLDQIIGYSKSMQEHRTPCRPFFTLEDRNRAEVTTASWLGSRALCLHLMCESRSGFGSHVIPCQPGLPIRVEKEGTKYRWIQRISEVSLTMITMMLEVGLQLSAGAGSIVPDLLSMAKEVTVLVRTGNSRFLTGVSKQGSTVVQDQESLQEAWRCLKDYLQPYLTPDMSAKHFHLHQVAYRDSDDPVAWLCESCITDGKRKFIID